MKIMLNLPFGSCSNATVIGYSQGFLSTNAT